MRSPVGSETAEHVLEAGPAGLALVHQEAQHLGVLRRDAQELAEPLRRVCHHAVRSRAGRHRAGWDGAGRHRAVRRGGVPGGRGGHCVRRHGIREPGHGAIDGGPPDVLLGAEVVADEPMRRPGGDRDVAQARRREAPCREGRERRLQDLLPRALGDSGRLTASTGAPAHPDTAAR
jgi:hypothetical protein